MVQQTSFLEVINIHNSLACVEVYGTQHLSRKDPMGLIFCWSPAMELCQFIPMSIYHRMVWGVFGLFNILYHLSPSPSFSVS